jgi:hypothetical protein
MLSEPAIEEKYYYPEVEAFDLINDRNELYRVTSIDNIGSIYPVNTQMAYGIYDIRNYDVIEIKYYWELLNVFAEGRIHGWIDFFKVDKRFLDFNAQPRAFVVQNAIYMSRDMPYICHVIAIL